jgi:prophage antirepressor-like protein
MANAPGTLLLRREFKVAGFKHSISVHGTVEEPLFLADQIGDLLRELGSMEFATRDFAEDEKRVGPGKHGTLYVTELGLMRLLSKVLKMPLAMAFQQWAVRLLKEIRLQALAERDEELAAWEAAAWARSEELSERDEELADRDEELKRLAARVKALAARNTELKRLAALGKAVVPRDRALAATGHEASASDEEVAAQDVKGETAQEPEGKMAQEPEGKTAQEPEGKTDKMPGTLRLERVFEHAGVKHTIRLLGTLETPLFLADDVAAALGYMYSEHRADLLVQDM